MRVCPSRAASSGLLVSADVGEGRVHRLQIHLEGVEQHGEHREVPEAADQVDQALLAELVEGELEGLVADEMVPQELGAELVGDLLVPADEVRLLVLR
jgi:hypothetical protein